MMSVQRISKKQSCIYLNDTQKIMLFIYADVKKSLLHPTIYILENIFYCRLCFLFSDTVYIFYENQ